MLKLTPVTFLMPVIALILVIVFYFILSKKSTNKSAFKRFTLIVMIVAYVLNFSWEIIQMPLYKNSSYNIEHIAFCALASVADAIMVLLIYFGFAVIYKNPLWVQNLTLPRILILMLVGGFGAVAAEIRHVSSGTWAYDTSMPIIPVVDVGLSPVLQFMLLPVCSYYLSFRMISMKKIIYTNQIIKTDGTKIN